MDQVLKDVNDMESEKNLTIREESAKMEADFDEIISNVQSNNSFGEEIVSKDNLFIERLEI